MRDIYRIDLELFSGADGTLQLAFYLLALAAVAVHLWYGWSKTVLKMAGAGRVWTVHGTPPAWPPLSGAPFLAARRRDPRTVHAEHNAWC